MNPTGVRPRDVLNAGARELESAVAPHGFGFRVTDEGWSSGGNHASGEYQRDDRRLELHLRWSLGLVRYHVGPRSLGHAEYVRAVQAVTGTSGQAAYPGFSDDPVAAFRHLAQDLERFGEIFLAGSHAAFAELHAWASEHPAPKGFAALP
jgi:hypothetical protein